MAQQQIDHFEAFITEQPWMASFSSQGQGTQVPLAGWAIQEGKVYGLVSSAQVQQTTSTTSLQTKGLINAEEVHGFLGYYPPDTLSSNNSGEQLQRTSVADDAMRRSTA